MSNRYRKNEYVVSGDICFVLVFDKNKNPKCFFIIDSEDLPKIDKLQWSSLSNGYIYNAKNKILLHRFLIGASKGFDVDHKDGFIKNNRRSNLRECSRSQNNANMQKLREQKLSIYKGVTKIKMNFKEDKWKAQIMVNGLNIYLGRFQTEEQAAKSYNEAALLYFGEFAFLNTIG